MSEALAVGNRQTAEKKAEALDLVISEIQDAAKVSNSHIPVIKQFILRLAKEVSETAVDDAIIEQLASNYVTRLNDLLENVDPKAFRFNLFFYKDCTKYVKEHIIKLRRDDAMPEVAQDQDSNYATLVASLTQRNHAFRQQLAAELAPALNARIRQMPHGTYEEKKELAQWVNDELEPLGLAVQCPKTGLPAKLRGHAGNWPGVGRFAFEVYHDGKRKLSTYSDALPELTLTDATPQQEPEKGWQQAVGTKASRSGRKLT
jgi:hypothetical protein